MGLTGAHFHPCSHRHFCFHEGKPHVMTTHGMSRTPTYITWGFMIQRCNNQRHKDYHSYGGRGISVCERWKTFENFYADMGLRPNGLTLDRINNDGNYEPGNCRWATPMQQQNNMRRNHTLSLHGETKTLSQWERSTGIKKGTILARLKYGWTAEDALTKPVGNQGPK